MRKGKGSSNIASTRNGQSRRGIHALRDSFMRNNASRYCANYRLNGRPVLKSCHLHRQSRLHSRKSPTGYSAAARVENRRETVFFNLTSRVLGVGDRMDGY